MNPLVSIPDSLPSRCRQIDEVCHILIIKRHFSTGGHSREKHLNLHLNPCILIHAISDRRPNLLHHSIVNCYIIFAHNLQSLIIRWQRYELSIKLPNNSKYFFSLPNLDKKLIPPPLLCAADKHTWLTPQGHKSAIKREQSQTCLSSVERKQTRQKVKLCEPYQNPDAGRLAPVVSYILPI